MPICFSSILSLLLLICAYCSPTIDPNTPIFRIQPDRHFTRGRLFYRVLQIDPISESLYVGAMNNVFRLWTFNINDTDRHNFFAHKQLLPNDGDSSDCRGYSNRDETYHCQNHVRFLFRLANEPTLYICSTNAYHPAVTLLNPRSLSTVQPSTWEIGICSGDPDMNMTAVFVESGNPGDIPSIYSGIRTGLVQENYLIYRPALVRNKVELFPNIRTMYTNSNWLDEPNFVASFDIGQYVYFFFRESAVEFENCGQAVYSRVARVCKSDRGGKSSVLRQIWTSFVKARLNCSLPGEFPVFFDHIQSVFKRDVEGDSIFYAIFSNGQSSFSGSAICSFNLRGIDTLFNTGAFKERISPTDAWTSTSQEQIPSPRPGTCVEDTLQLSDSVLHFVKNHLLMNDAILPLDDGPLFVRRDVQLTKLVVDKLTTSNSDYNVIWAGTTDGRIFKSIQWADVVESDRRISRLISIYRMPRSEPIVAIELLDNEFIYVAQDSAISQLEVSQCHLYLGCTTCISDPYCSWNTPRRRCYRKDQSHIGASGWVLSRPDRHEQATSLCGPRPDVEMRLLYSGEAVHFPCSSTVTSMVHWRKNNKTLESFQERVLFTVDGGLVLINVSADDSGVFDCYVQGQILFQYNLLVDDVNCQKPTNLQQFQTVYREWCREFQVYKTTMTKWQRWYEQNAHCANAPNFKIENKQKSNRLGNQIWK